MSKPLGIALEIRNDGLPRMFVRPIDRVSDLVWDAVREAVHAGWTPEQFRNEAISCWTQTIADDAKEANSQATQAFLGTR